MLNRRPGWPIHMKRPFRVFFLGWWLMGYFGMFGGETYPSPVISVYPIGVVPFGGNVTINCSCGILSQIFWHLNKFENGYGTVTCDKVQPSCEVAFSMNMADLSDGGIYSCRYTENKLQWSAFSNEVYINITDPNLPKPSIKLEHRGKDASGLNVMITCEGPETGLSFALYNSREQIAFQIAGPNQSMAMFSVNIVRPEDARNYRCQYRDKEKVFLWSKPSDRVELEVEDFSGSKASTDAYKWAGIGAGLLLILLLLLLAFVLHRKRRRGPIVKEESQLVSKLSEPDGGEDPEEIAYVVLNHKSPKAKQMSSSGTASESCVYASVAKH